MQIAQIPSLEYPRNLCKSHNLLTFTIYTPLGVYIVNTSPIYIIYYNFIRYYIYYIYIYLQVYNILYSFGLHPNIRSFPFLFLFTPLSLSACHSSEFPAISILIFFIIPHIAVEGSGRLSAVGLGC